MQMAKSIEVHPLPASPNLASWESSVRLLQTLGPSLPGAKYPRLTNFAKYFPGFSMRRAFCSRSSARSCCGLAPVMLRENVGKARRQKAKAQLLNLLECQEGVGTMDTHMRRYTTWRGDIALVLAFSGKTPPPLVWRRFMYLPRRQTGGRGPEAHATLPQTRRYRSWRGVRVATDRQA